MAEKKLSLDYIRGLDFWRSVLLILGVFLHAMIIGHPSEWVSVITRKFRMETFFVISGMLSQLSFSKRGGAAWLKERLVQLAVPAFFGVLIINQIWLILYRENYGIKSSEISAWYGPPLLHFWFLFVLIGCSFLQFYTYAKHVIILEIIDRLVFKKWFLPLLMVFLFASLLMQGVGFYIVTQFEESRATARIVRDFSSTVMAIPYYGMYYFWGISLARNQESLQELLRIKRGRIFVTLLAVLLVAAIACYNPGFVLNRNALDQSFGLENLFDMGTRAVLAPLISLLIIQVAFRYDLSNRLIKRIAKSGYTLYVVHFVIIAALMNIGRVFQSFITFSYLTIVFCTILLSYGFHFIVVDRFKVVKFLVNGSTKTSVKHGASSILGRIRSSRRW